jgi:hypothetical protein
MLPSEGSGGGFDSHGDDQYLSEVYLDAYLTTNQEVASSSLAGESIFALVAQPQVEAHG